MTAGKYKRTLTPTKKIDPQDQAKLKEDIEAVLALFKTFVAKNRPGLDIDKVATGETWYGPDALANNLVDKLVTVDEVLSEHAAEGREVYSITYQGERRSPLAALTGASTLGQRLNGGFEGGGLGGLTVPGARLPTSWKGLALTLLGRVLAPTSTLEASVAARPTELLHAARGAAVVNEESLTADELTATFENELLASRMAAEARPMLRWDGAVDMTASDVADSWPGL